MIRKLCNINDLPTEGRLKAFVDEPLALCVGVLDGVPYALDNVCPHQRAALSAGRMEGRFVVCPVHGWKFRLEDGSPDHPGDPPVPAYEVRIYGTEVFVRVPGREESGSV